MLVSIVHHLHICMKVKNLYSTKIIRRINRKYNYRLISRNLHKVTTKNVLHLHVPFKELFDLSQFKLFLGNPFLNDSRLCQSGNIGIAAFPQSSALRQLTLLLLCTEHSTLFTTAQCDDAVPSKLVYLIPRRICQQQASS